MRAATRARHALQLLTVVWPCWRWSLGLPVAGLPAATAVIQYLIFAECVVLVVLLFRGRRPVTQRWFAVWCSEVLLSVGLVSFLSGIGSDFFPDHSSPLIAAVLPAMMSLATLGLWAITGAILTPSTTSRCSCGACVFHPRWITVFIGVFLLVANVVTAFAMNEPSPILSLYFGLPAIVMLLVVLGLRTAVANTIDSKIGSIAMLGGLAVVLVGVVVLLTLTEAFGCGVYFVKSGSTLCPLPASFDAESVFLCFLGVGIVAMWLGASQLACEPLDASLTQRLVSEPKSKYFR